MNEDIYSLRRIITEIYIYIKVHIVNIDLNKLVKGGKMNKQIWITVATSCVVALVVSLLVNGLDDVVQTSPRLRGNETNGTNYLPDLIVQNMKVHQVIQNGSKYNLVLKADIKNIGQVYASSSKTHFWIETGENASGVDYYASTSYIMPGQTKSAYAYYWNIPGGAYSSWAYADGLYQVVESNEGNNIYSLDFNVPTISTVPKAMK